MPHFEGLEDIALERVANELIAAACGRFGLTLIDATFVGYSANVVYRIAAARGGEQAEYALRICDPKSYTTPQLEAECHWMAAVARDSSVAPPEPLSTDGGQYIAEVSVEGLPVSRRCAMFRWLEGDAIDEPRPQHLRSLGAMTAELHNHADTYAPCTPVDRPNANWASILTRFVEGHFSASWAGHDDDVVTEEDRDVFMRAAARLTEDIAAIPRDRDCGLIHADLHQWNVLYHDGEPHPIDFDDCHFAPYMTDVATTLWYLQDDNDFPALREAYLAGYRTRRDTPPDWASQVEVFAAARYMSMLSWILAWPTEHHVWSGMETIARYARRLSEYLDAPS